MNESFRNTIRDANNKIQGICLTYQLVAGQ